MFEPIPRSSSCFVLLSHPPAAVMHDMHTVGCSASAYLCWVLPCCHTHATRSCCLYRQFQVKKLGPERNCLRRAKCGPLLPAGNDGHADGDETATPRYNAAILTDILMQHHLEYMHNLGIGTNDAIISAIALIKTWLRQRGMDGTKFGAFNGFVATMLVAHLLDTRQIYRESSAFQIFRVFISFIATSKWDKEGIAMKHHHFSEDFPTQENAPSLGAFNNAFDVVLVDPSGFLNLLANMTLGAYQDLTHEATAALLLLDDRVRDGFDSMFMTPINFNTKFDVVVKCDAITAAIARRYPSQLLDRAGDWQAFALSFLASIMRRALGDRAKLVVGQLRTIDEWPVVQAPPCTVGNVARGAFTVTVGLLLNADKARRRLDMGPPADMPEAVDFRNFWGPKSSLRRFPDGSILEAVLWDHEASDSQFITQSIVHHALERHARVPKDQVAASVNAVDVALYPAGKTVDSGEEESRRVIRRLEQLLKQLRDSSDSLPLAINDLKGLSPTFRYCEPFPPQAGDEQWPTWTPALEVLLQFESTSLRYAQTTVYLR